MRHRHAKKYLSRDTSHRSALMKNLAAELINKGSIETTLAKAKFVRPYVEKLITKAKDSKGFVTIKYLKSKLTTDETVKHLMENVAPLYKERNGGYTRITKLGNRDGDNAFLAKIEFVKDGSQSK